MPRSTYKNKPSFIPLIACSLILLALTTYIIYTQMPQVKEDIINTLPELRKPEKSYRRPEPIKPATKPTIALEQLILGEIRYPTPRTVTSSKIMLPIGYMPDEILEFSSEPIAYNSVLRVPKPDSQRSNKIYVVNTYVNTIMEEAGIVGVGFISSAIDTISAPTIRKGMAERYIRVADDSFKPLSRLIVFEVSAVETEITSVAKAIKLGFGDVIPLAKGEPGGRVIGKCRDIQGVFRFARIQHNLADWWADQSSLVALTEWLNTQTHIKTDMNVEGGSIHLTDPKLLKSPLLFFTGHDPSNVRSRNLVRGAPLKNRLSEPERNGLRQYLIDREGFVFFDDCGVNAPAQEFLRLMVAQIKYAMPEYSVNKIPNNHEVYNNYYEMGGPPIGFDIFWWGTHPPKRNFLEGITIGDHLCVIICRRDYMCSMETVSFPSKTVHYSPGVYRFLTNTVIYALTHGKISDYSKYVPEKEAADKIPIDGPTGVPKLE